MAVDALEQSAAIEALALSMARSLSAEELARAALLLTQLGTTLGTVSALRELDETGTTSTGAET